MSFQLKIKNGQNTEELFDIEQGKTLILTAQHSTAQHSTAQHSTAQ